MPSTLMGVDWKGPGRVPHSSRGVSFGSHFQTISSSPTLATVISSATECPGRPQGPRPTHLPALGFRWG